MQDFLYDRTEGLQAQTGAKPYQLYGRGQDKSPDPGAGRLRDYEYFKSLYPARAKKMQRYAEEVCDEMEYEGSPIYDEYPDRIVLDLMVRRAAGRIPADNSAPELVRTACISSGLPGEKEHDPSVEKTAGTVHAAYGPVYGNRLFSGYTAWEPEEAGVMKIQERCPWMGERVFPDNPAPPQGRPAPPPGRPVPPPAPKREPETGGNISPEDILAVLLMSEIRERRRRREGGR